MHRLQAMRRRLELHFAALAALALGAGAWSCTSAQTSTTPTAPSEQKCQVSAGGSPTSFAASGGSGTLTIGASRDCTWSLSVGAGWVSISGATSGQGDATMGYTVAANPQPSPRSANVSVSGQSVQLSQAAAPCTYSLSRATDSVGAAGGSLSVGVTTLTGCNWTASSSAAWITIASGGSGSSSGTVGLTAAANTGAARVGQVNVAGQTYTLNQSAGVTTPNPGPSPGPGPGPAPPPPPPPPPDPGGDMVEFFGVVTNVGGKCPNLTFTVSPYTVATDKDTKFKDISCGDVAKGGRTVSGEGLTDSTGVVHADLVKKAGEHD